ALRILPREAHPRVGLLDLGGNLEAIGHGLLAALDVARTARSAGGALPALGLGLGLDVVRRRHVDARVRPAVLAAAARRAERREREDLSLSHRFTFRAARPKAAAARAGSRRGLSSGSRKSRRRRTSSIASRRTRTESPRRKTLPPERPRRRCCFSS